VRTLVIIGLIVGPVVVFGAPLALASGVTLRPEWATAVFAVAGAVALAGLLLLALSFRRRSAPVAAAAAPHAAPGEDAQPTSPPLAPLSVVRNARPGRYVRTPEAVDPDPVTEPAPGLITLRPRDHAEPSRQTVGAS
jgi:hypothetical protein